MTHELKCVTLSLVLLIFLILFTPIYSKSLPLPTSYSKSGYHHSPWITVVIDPGHGGYDPGATGTRGVHEKDVVLKIAQYLQKKINAQKGFKAYLTRKADYYISLRNRLTIARKKHADLFIAIHADAISTSQITGASVYALSLKGATSEAARWLAQKENQSELRGGVELRDKNYWLKTVLLNLSQVATIRASLTIGSILLHSIARIAHLHCSNVEQAAFVVLKSPDIPSLLVETGFLSNPIEEVKLQSITYQKRLAAVLATGIENYFQHAPPLGTWLYHSKYNRKYTHS